VQTKSLLSKGKPVIILWLGTSLRTPIDHGDRAYPKAWLSSFRFCTPLWRGPDTSIFPPPIPAAVLWLRTPSTPARFPFPFRFSGAAAAARTRALSLATARSSGDWWEEDCSVTARKATFFSAHRASTVLSCSDHLRKRKRRGGGSTSTRLLPVPVPARTD
jgi:hypothetical protein